MSLVNVQSRIHYFKDEFYKLEAIFLKIMVFQIDVTFDYVTSNLFNLIQ
jgi:hypothetical protein